MHIYQNTKRHTSAPPL